MVQQAINLWVPARAFVMDTYIHGNDIGIVEIRGICHAGMYDADLRKVVAALDAMPMNADIKSKPQKPSSTSRKRQGFV